MSIEDVAGDLEADEEQFNSQLDRLKEENGDDTYGVKQTFAENYSDSTLSEDY